MTDIHIPKGFRFAGVHCGIKSTTAEDITLIVADRPCVAAGVYTKNQVVAAPVVLDRERTPSASIRALVVNSGNANACTGVTGHSNAQRMLDITAELTDASQQQTLVMSTGIIGEQLPMPCVEQGIAAAAQQLSASEAALQAAARGIMTTDTAVKISSRAVPNTSAPIHIAGIAKGSGMIGPNMATMLSAIMTDATLTPEIAQQLLSELVDESFNSINVDGHTSTNDTVLLLASGQGEPLSGAELEEFKSALRDVCIELAKKIVDDGEGATHLVEIAIQGAANKSDARVIAEAIANSPLVKTAIAGNDPNWGRIVSAAGYAGAPIQIQATTLKLNGTVIFEAGQPVPFDGGAASQFMQENRDVLIELSVGGGQGATRYWTCDLTHGYVTINAEYHT